MHEWSERLLYCMHRLPVLQVVPIKKSDSFLADEEHKIMMTFEDGRTDFLLSFVQQLLY
jgi:hypothetical protein